MDILAILQGVNTAKGALEVKPLQNDGGGDNTALYIAGGFVFALIIAVIAIALLSKK